MTRLTKYITLLVSAVVLLSACNKSYPELYIDEEKEITKELVNHELLGRIPIILALNDEQYSVYTRGMGAFEDWGTNDSKWVKAKFRTFAQLTSTDALVNARANGYYTGDVDYSKHDSVHCLNIWDVPMMMNHQKYIHFVDKDGKPMTRWYNYSFQDFKYRFATVHVDDADDGDAYPYPKEGKARKILMPVKIDGTQDIIHAYAYHTDEKIAEEAEKLVDDQDKIFSGKIYDYLYSSWAGRRGFYPIFHANHLLTKFVFHIQGAYNEKKGTKDYQNVIVKSIKLQTKNKATLTILDDAWTDGPTYEQSAAAEEVLRPDPSSLEMFKVKMKTNELSPCLIPYIDQEGFYTSEQARTVFQIKDGEHVQLSEIPVLLMPDSQYRLILTIDYINGKQDAHGNLSGLNWNNESNSYFIMRDTEVNYTIDASRLKLVDSKFRAGSAYTIYLNVYGPEQIVGTLEPCDWIDGGNTTIIDPDE